MVTMAALLFLPLTTTALAEDTGWEEPEVEKESQGRDEEARRRLVELETWRRKMEAEQARKEAETEESTRFEFALKYKARVNSRNNFHLNNPLQQWPFDNTSFFDQRVELQVNAGRGPLLGAIQLDKGNFLFDWKEDSEGTLERWSEFHLVNAALVRQVFAQYTGPLTVKVGRQIWDVGHSIVLEGPMDSVKLQGALGKLPWGVTTVSAGYLSIAGGWRSYSRFLETGPPAGNRDAVFSASNKLDGYYVDLDVRPTRRVRLVPYALKVFDRGRFGDADLNLDKDFSFDTTPRDGGFEPLWTGLSLSGDVSGFKLDAEATYLSGNLTRDRDLSAHLLFGRVARSVLPAGGRSGAGSDQDGRPGLPSPHLTTGLEFGRGTGNEAGDAPGGKARNFNGLFLCRDRHKFGNIFSEDLRAGYFFWDSNLSNVTYARWDADLSPVENVHVSPSIAKIWTSESVLQGRGPVRDWSRGEATSASRTHDVGWEADLDIGFPIYKGLAGFVNVGAFRPGKAYARPDGRRASSAFEAVMGSEFAF